MALYPYIRLGYKKPNQAATKKEIWMREHWLTRGAETDIDKWFLMRTPAVDLEPGEIRYFSVTSSSNITNVNRLTPTWNEGGLLSFASTWATGYSQKAPMSGMNHCSSKILNTLNHHPFWQQLQ